MSRKVILAALGVVGAILGVIQTEFGLALNVGGIIAFLGAAVIYIQQEAKLDKDRLAAQKDKWKDPKFWLAALGAGVVALGEVVTLPLDPAIINSILAIILGIIFKTQKTATA